MDRISFLNTGGYGFELDDLDKLQTNLTMLQELVQAICGNDPAIISGCDVAGSNTNDGYVCINGELLPFVGGPTGTNVTIVEEVTSKDYEDGSSKPDYYTRYATFALTGTAWNTFKKVINLLNVTPPGVIVMWSGTIANIPSGWYLCDGSNGTPNLSGKFIVGYNSADADYNAIGNSGGAKTVTLDVTQIPSHNHTFQRDFTGGGGSGGDSGNTGTPPYGTRTTDNTGGGQPHENRPPYYTLAYIMKG